MNNDLWFLPGPPDDDTPPLPRADRHALVDPADWTRAQAALPLKLAAAAQALGALDAVLMDDPGMIRRLAITEVGAMLWAAGTPLPREEIGRDLMAGRASSDRQIMAKARWALRRLEGQSDPADLRGFLGLHRVGDAAGTPRSTGAEFDAAARDFRALIADDALHPMTRAAMALMAWPLAGLSPDEDLAECACFAARIAASALDNLPFAPLGDAGRRIWRSAGGTPEALLAAWLDALRDGARHARAEVARLDDWAARARDATTSIKGSAPARVIAALRATPLMTTEMVAQEITASRDTAERVLARLLSMGLITEITGTRRFRLWSAP
ncbi:MAG: hypothetical protein Q4G26_00595 [Paracoccus sp. (in: a-proteobacteria)]|nr:hypothetical protein [Paracoccus sp. (in: a-proteobacteria)]